MKTSKNKEQTIPQKMVPYISPSKSLPEITPKAVILGIILAMLLAASNAYLGLKVGLTVTACVPAAVISMAVLRFFRRSNILENNMVQTIASAGEVITAGVIFTLPALLLMGFWDRFPFLETMCIAIIGGVMGVLFSVPLRRALIVEHPLPYPEGVATAEVLKAGESGASGAKDLIFAGLFAAVIKFLQSGFQVLSESASYFTKAGSTIFGFGTGLAPVLLGAGYIIGVRIGTCIILGAGILWLVILPIYGSLYGLPDGETASQIARIFWAKKLRFVGVGAMIVGGLWALVSLIKPIKSAVKSSFDAIRESRIGEKAKILRTEYDIPMAYVLISALVLVIPVFILFSYIIDAHDMPVTSGLFWATIAFSTVFSFFVGFLCAAIGGYMAGIVGSSSNPLSGVTIGALLIVSFLLLALLGTQVDFAVQVDDALAAAATAIVIASVACCAAALSCDNLQDLKTGQLVGATPWKQQAMLMVGVVAGAIVITPILQLLYEAYGIGSSLPREGMDPNQVLSAPQATVMASVAKGVFLRDLEWSLVLLGALIGICLIVLNKVLKSAGSSWSFPVLAVATGLYLPYDVTVPLFLGSLLNFFALQAIKKKKKAQQLTKEGEEIAERRGTLFASGAIAGEAIVGILLSIPFAIHQSTSVFVLDVGFSEGTKMLLGIGLIVLFCISFYKIGTSAYKK